MALNPKTALAFQSIRPAKINFYLRAMRAMGYQANDILRGTNVTEISLKDRFTLIQIPDYIRIVSNMLELSNEPSLAFKLAEQLESGDLGMLGCAVSASQNFQQGIEIWRSYNQLFFGELILVRQFQEAQSHYFEFIPQVPLYSHLLQFFMEEKIGIEIVLVKRLNDCAMKLNYFGVTYRKPEYSDVYDDYLGLNVEFGAERNLAAIDVDDENYAKRFESANEEVLDVCLAQLKIVADFADSQATLSPKIRQIFMRKLPEIATIDELAAECGMSKRTFSRHLGTEQTSYKLLLAEVREELAKNYLLTTAMTTDEIAQLIGFKETSSFCKAFKQWTGLTTTAYKEENVLASCSDVVRKNKISQ